MRLTQQAFTGDGKLLKGGLHCHTTRSDGKITPEETIGIHARAGYDFLALTDHRYYNFQDFAPGSGALILPGMEMDGNISTDDGMCYHIVAIGPEAALNGYKQDERVQNCVVSSQAEFQPVIDGIRARNNLAIYCHPQWSCTPARSFENLEGCFAMEIWNTGCAFEDGLDTDNGFIWDELLVRGKRIFAVATDDGHHARHHANGWVMVNAQKSNASILAALEAGAFYSSCGPEIYDFCIEDGVARVECSPCEYIQFKYGLHPTHFIKNEQGLITRAERPLPEAAKYLRAVVMDAQGRKAWTNPIYIK